LIEVVAMFSLYRVSSQLFVRCPSV